MGTFLEKEEFMNWMMSTNHILKNTLSTQKKQFKETLKKKQNGTNSKILFTSMKASEYIPQTEG